MLCKCYWIVLYIVHVTAFCLGGGGFFSGHGVVSCIHCCHCCGEINLLLDSSDNQAQLDGLIRKAFKRGRCCNVFKVDELINDADRKLFRRISHHKHCLHPSCPNKDHVAYSSPSEAEDTTTHCRA